jgi:hypothetical protein
MPYFTKKTLKSGEQRSERDGRRNWAYDKASQEASSAFLFSLPSLALLKAVESKSC